MESIWLLLAIVVAAVLVLFVLIIKAKLDPFISLTVVSVAVGLAAGLPIIDKDMTHPGIVTVMTTGLGAALGKIAALIALGAIFGEILRASGASNVLGERMLRLVGVKRGPLAMTLCGLVVGVTIFFDPAIILLSPLAIAVAKQSRKSLLFFAIPMAAAALSMHALLPPHPGPVAIAGVLGANYGLLILFGILCVLPGVAGAFFYSQWIAKRLPSVVTEFGGVATEENGSLGAGTAATAAAGAGATGTATLPPVTGSTATPTGVMSQIERSDRQPGLGRTLFVLLLPIVLILLQTATSKAPTTGSFGWLVTALQFIGQPWIALTISCLVAFGVLVLGLGGTREDFVKITGAGLRPVGQIIMTSAGGAVFGSVIQASGIGPRLLSALHDTGLPIVIFAFLITALLRGTLGTTTAAVIAVATLIGPTVAAGHYNGPELALIAVAIAAGGMCLSHVNDTGFWVISRYFGIPVGSVVRSWSVAVTIMGVITGLIATIIFVAIS